MHACDWIPEWKLSWPTDHSWVEIQAFTHTYALIITFYSMIKCAALINEFITNKYLGVMTHPFYILKSREAIIFYGSCIQVMQQTLKHIIYLLLLIILCDRHGHFHFITLTGNIFGNLKNIDFQKSPVSTCPYAIL